MPRTPVVTDGLVLELIGKYAKLGTVGGGPGNNTDPTNNWVSTLPGVGGAAGYFTFTEGDGWRGNGSESDPYALEWDGPHPGEERYYWFTITDYPAVYNSASYSWEVWLWCDNFTTGWMNAIIDFGGYTISGFRLGYNSSGMVYYWNSQNGGTLDTTSGYTAMKLNAWNHIVTTHNSGDNQYYNYINGTQENIGTTGTYVVPSSGAYLPISLFRSWCP